MNEKKEKNCDKRMRNKKLLWLILPALVLIAFMIILIINGTYQVDRDGSRYMLSSGEKAELTLYYNGADNMPESEVIICTAYEKIDLPVLTKEGYHFIGWASGGAFRGLEFTVSASYEQSAYAWFEEDYSDIESNVAIYNYKYDYNDYFQKGEYNSVNSDIDFIFIEDGYKAIVYEKENFEGEKTIVAYSSYEKMHIGSMKIVEIESEGIEMKALNDENKVKLIYTFAPRIWWAEGEEYFATTVENVQNNMERVMTDKGYFYMINELDSPSYKCDYIYGSLTDCKGYAFVCEKNGGFLDLSYFVFTPYNKAKEVFGMEFGNHIGDWEHITVRLLKYEEAGKSFYRPIIVDYSAHDFRNYVAWDDVQTIENTHPIAYTALGSHGMWAQAGTHVYVNAVVVKLTDECSEGTAWDLWHDGNIETYSYDSLKHTGYGIGNSEWNTCFDFDCYNEDSNAVLRWGNKGWYLPIQIYPSLETGPTGPQYKPVLFNYYTLEEKY